MVLRWKQDKHPIPDRVRTFASSVRQRITNTEKVHSADGHVIYVSTMYDFGPCIHYKGVYVKRTLKALCSGALPAPKHLKRQFLGEYKRVRACSEEYA